MDSILNYSFIVRALRGVASIGRSGVTSRVLRAVGTAVRESLPGRAVYHCLPLTLSVGDVCSPAVLLCATAFCIVRDRRWIPLGAVSQTGLAPCALLRSCLRRRRTA